MRLIVDQALKNLLMPLSPHEFAFLESSIVEEGCREKLIVWEEESVLVDGHNRYEICKANSIDFDIEYKSFPSREAVEDWIDKNQAARRNLSPDDFRIVTGRIYNRRKKQHGGERGASVQIEHLKTSEIVADELGISDSSVRRNGQRAEVYDSVVAFDSEAAEAAKSVPQAVIAEARRQSPELAAQIVKEAAKPHVANNSGEQEWYTPTVYLDAARCVLGEIDLDPASSDVAQKNVAARTYFTKEDDGLTQDWKGKVFLNPPYSSGLVEKFIEKLVDSSSRVDEAIVLVNNATETRWFQLLLNNCSAVCFPVGRIRFLDATGEARNTPLQGQAFAYIGNRVKEFKSQFSEFGPVVRA